MRGGILAGFFQLCLIVMARLLVPAMPRPHFPVMARLDRAICLRRYVVADDPVEPGHDE
jgi:hypothetical protein